MVLERADRYHEFDSNFFEITGKKLLSQLQSAVPRMLVFLAVARKSIYKLAIMCRLHIAKQTLNAIIHQIAKAVEEAQSIIVLGHARPDGDAIGSTIALASSLKALGKNVHGINEDPVPATLAFLDDSDQILQPGHLEKSIQPDLAIALDCSNRDRLGTYSLNRLSAVNQWINIDHHGSNEKYGDLHWIDPHSPATGEMIYELIHALRWPLTKSGVDALFVAISTDTGSFQYPSTTARTYEIIADLVRKGANPGRLSSLTYDHYPLRRVALLRELLNNLRLTSGNRCASWHLDLATKNRLQLQPDDSEGLINQIRGIDTVIVAGIFEELHDGSIRVSLRSKDAAIANVSEICARFGGGGHSLAAGARVNDSLPNVQSLVLQSIDESIQKAIPIL